MQLVLLMPGQGSQKVGMAKDLHDAFPAARDVLERVNDALDTSLSTLMFEGPADELTRTHNAQPALLAHSAAAWAVIRESVESHCVAAAGHSLGEFSAYHVAGAFALTDAARVVRKRGMLMYEQGVARPGAMTAIIGALTKPIDDICSQASAEGGLVVPANYNTSEQVVISGEVAAVERAGKLALEAGAKKCIPLPVSGAFHSPLMAPAAESFAAALDATPMTDPTFPVVANVNASSVTNAATAKTLLVQQLTAAVRWTSVIESLANQFPEALFVEVGSGTALSGMVKRIAPHVKTAPCGTPADVDSLLKRVAA